MSEISDTGQNSIVFLGRESFRMQVVGADAIPGRAWDEPTARIIERRSSDRRRSREISTVASSAPTAAWNRILALSLATFACGVLVTLSVERLSRPARTAPQVAAPAALPASAPLVKLADLAAGPATIPPPSPAPAIDPRPRKTLAAMKAPARAPVARPRRPGPPKPPEVTEADPTETPPASAARPRKWVDPFAD